MNSLQSVGGKDSSKQGHLAGKYLTFALSKESYGIEILKVQEIIGVPSITRVPKCPDYLKGIINLRGRIIPVIDLRLRFGMSEIPYTEKTCIVVVNVRAGEERVAVGLIVDNVHEVVKLEGDNIESVPDYGNSLNSTYIVAMGKSPGSETFQILLDVDKVVSQTEIKAAQALN
jgi:purine-binding chemotaxis protein CheW